MRFLAGTDTDASDDLEQEFKIQPQLPSGMHLNPDTGEISGTPTRTSFRAVCFSWHCAVEFSQMSPAPPRAPGTSERKSGRLSRATARHKFSKSEYSDFLE